MRVLRRQRQTMQTQAMVWLASVLLVLSMSVAKATVLQDFDFPSLVAQSQAIFVGRVQGQRQELQGNLVITVVSFAIETSYKGNLATPSIELGFVGGQSGNAGVQVQGQFIPPVGVRGVFFIERPDAKQVNPLTGWQQGFFPLMKGDDGKDYLDMRQRPDLKIPGLEVDPLVTKMQGLGFSQDAINAKVPRANLFPLDDFRTAIADEMLQPQTGTSP